MSFVKKERKDEWKTNKRFEGDSIFSQHDSIELKKNRLRNFDLSGGTKGLKSNNTLSGSEAVHPLW